MIIRRDTSNRRERIVALLREQGSVQIPALAERFRVSTQTLRKDLNFLDIKGICTRSSGGAILRRAGLSPTEQAIEVKRTLFAEEKARIGRAAAALIKNDESVLLDSGTTTTAIARALKKFSRLTVITNAVNIAAELSGTDFEVLLTGGSLRKNSFSLVGPLAEDMLHEMHADILFLGVDGFDLDVGLTTPNVMESRVNRAMVKASSMVVAVCDSTKFNRRSLSKIVDASAIHHVITDSDLPQETAEGLRTLNIKLTLV